LEEKPLIGQIARELKRTVRQVGNTVDLLDQDNTVPFIARYRKETTGSLDEENIRAIQDRIRYLRSLEERKQSVLKSISEQGKLTPGLEEKIRSAPRLQDVEDLYLPYKPKRRTRATVAREKGLEPLAVLMLNQETLAGNRIGIASSFIDPEKGVPSAVAALSGARDIAAEVMAEDADVRRDIRLLSAEKGRICSEVADEALAARDYALYGDFSEAVKTVPPYRILALNRGERGGILRVWVEVDKDDLVERIEKMFITRRESLFTEDLESAARDAYDRLIAPAMQREIRNVLTEKADAHAIGVFASNLRALLFTPPLRGKIILGIDPGYRTGCKAAVIDATGKYLMGTTLYPHPPQKQWEESKSVLKALVDAYGVDVIAIGNGTAGRETEQLVAELIRDVDREVGYTLVNEAGASVYSASPVARKEFPDLDASMRGNISIARRLLDPLSELVKIDPKSIGVGLYQHDVNQSRLAECLDQVVESCVNAVGVDLNTASSSLLRYVSGINSRVAEAIVRYREEHGRFPNREALKNVRGVGHNCFVQAAGFLRITEGDVFFDATAVHPESYPATEKLLERLGLSASDIRTDGSLVKKRFDQSALDVDRLAAFCGYGRETLMDILDSLGKPGRDPRDAKPGVILRGDVLSIEDLREGMILKGTVRNVVDFGAFVDIGVHQDGLVHLSQMARKYVQNPLDVVRVGDIVEVRILKVDAERGRIGLSMILD